MSNDPEFCCEPWPFATAIEGLGSKTSVCLAVYIPANLGSRAWVGLKMVDATPKWG